MEYDFKKIDDILISLEEADKSVLLLNNNLLLNKILPTINDTITLESLSGIVYNNYKMASNIVGYKINTDISMEELETFSLDNKLRTLSVSTEGLIGDILTGIGKAIAAIFKAIFSFIGAIFNFFFGGGSKGSTVSSGNIRNVSETIKKDNNTFLKDLHKKEQAINTKIKETVNTNVNTTKKEEIKVEIAIYDLCNPSLPPHKPLNEIASELNSGYSNLLKDNKLKFIDTTDVSKRFDTSPLSYYVKDKQFDYMTIERIYDNTVLAYNHIVMDHNSGNLIDFIKTLSFDNLTLYLDKTFPKLRANLEDVLEPSLSDVKLDGIPIHYNNSKGHLILNYAEF